MLTVNKLIAAGPRPGAGAAQARHAASSSTGTSAARSRFDATDSAGRMLGVFLPRGQVVRGGDVLVAEDGTLIRVDAAPQPVLVVRHCPDARLGLRPAARGLPPGQPSRAAGAEARPPAARARPCAGRHAAPDAPDRQRRSGALRARVGRLCPGGMAMGMAMVTAMTTGTITATPRPRTIDVAPARRRARGHAAGAAGADAAGLAGAAGGRLQLFRRPGGRRRGRPRARRGPGRRLADGPAAAEPGTRRPAGAGPGPAGMAGARPGAHRCTERLGRSTPARAPSCASRPSRWAARWPSG